MSKEWDVKEKQQLIEKYSQLKHRLLSKTTPIALYNMLGRDTSRSNNAKKALRLITKIVRNLKTILTNVYNRITDKELLNFSLRIDQSLTELSAAVGLLIDDQRTSVETELDSLVMGIESSAEYLEKILELKAANNAQTVGIMAAARRKYSLDNK